MQLTQKELFAVKELAQGYKQQEIADRQFRSLAVIKKHVQNAMAKMHARNSAHLVAICKDLGLIAVLVSVVAGIGDDVRVGRLTRSVSVRLIKKGS